MKLVRRRRLPGLLNISGALVVVLAVAVIALHAAGEAPPAVAEFAPQAQQILQAPAELTSRFGNGSGGAAVGPALPPSPATSAAGLPPDAVLRRCVGDPPRQIEDPQSPPCVPYWHGNNDGSTYKGVSTNTITVGVPNSCNNDQANCVNDLFSFFNHRFELYGRRLVPVDTSGDGEGCGDSNGCPDAQRSAAETADQVRHIFASSDCADTWFYCDALAERGIISVTTRPSYSSAVLARDSPYLWQYAMAKDDEFANIGRWVCSRLAGWPARHAGDPLLQTSRVFGIVSNVEQTGEESDDSSLTDSLAACGIRNIDNIENGDNNAASNGTAATGIARLRADHVTTVICLCHTLVLSQFQNSADSQGYMPEWLVSTYLLNDADWSLHELGPAPSQLAHTFGVTFEPRQVPLAENPAYWAYREADPSARVAYAALPAGQVETVYRSLLLLASGIQMAGPDLTPPNFARGLHGTAFPNPDTMIRAGHVGFYGKSSAMTIDGAEFWWSNTDKGPFTDGSAGTICYVDEGLRHTYEDWPKGGDPFFQPPCE